MKQYGLIGYPLSHSFSKKYFTQKFAEESIDAKYELYPLSSIHQFEGLIQSTPNLQGLNVTIPYKKDVIQYLNNSTDAVKEMGACNCIKIEDGKLFGHNTDVVGFELALAELLKPTHTHALILGTGGAAAAVEYVLKKHSINYAFVSRNSPSKSKAFTYEQIDEDVIKEHTLIINSTPLGMYPKVDECPPIPYQYLTPHHYLFDLIYNPAETLFMKRGAQNGAATKNGGEMLIIQAEESWKIWNNL